MKYISYFFKPFRKIIILGVFFKAIGAFVDIALPMLLSNVIDIGIGSQDINMVYKYALFMFCLCVFSCTSNILASIFSAKASENIGHDIRTALYAHKQTLSIADLKSHSYSALTTRVVYDVDTIAKFVGLSMRMLVRCFILAIGGIVIAITLDPYITMILFATMFAITIISVTILKLTGKWFRRVSEGIDGSTAVIRESITGIKTIKSFAKQKHELSKFEKRIYEIYKAQVVSGSLSASLSPLISVISNTTLALILLTSANRIEAGSFDAVRITGFVVYINMFVLAMVGLSRMIVRYSKANASSLRIHEILSIKPSTHTNSNNISSDSSNALELSNLTFAYKDKNVLENINLTLKHGQSLGIIGKTGSGKTTLIELLTGIYQNFDGDIFINGTNMTHISKTDLARKIGIARQKFDIFTDSIEKNIILDKPFDENEFNTAISNAQIKDFVDKVGRDLNIRQSGTNLSGGQRQRINLARLFYSNPEILILDDVSSALDTATNANLNKALQSLSNDKTIIIISNKVDSIKHCSKILVLDEGKVTGLDTHENLLKTNNDYKELDENQFKGDVIYED